MKSDRVKALAKKYGIDLTLDEKRWMAYSEAFYEFPNSFEDYLYSLVNNLTMKGELINIALYIDGIR